MAFTRIQNTDFNNRGAMSLPNQPTIGAQELKRKFDEDAREVVAPAVNRLIGELEANESAQSIGATAPAGRTGTTVQGVLNSVSSDLATLEVGAGSAIAQAHSHANKEIIDKFSESSGGAPLYDGEPIGQTSDYTALDNKPQINSVTLSGNLSLSDIGVPTTLQALSDDTGHRTVSDTEKSTWNSKSTVSVTQVVSTGTKVATITVDGNDTDIYATGGGGGSVNDAFKVIKGGATSITASGEDTLSIVGGSNVTVTGDASTNSITISAAGGGQSTGDMLMSDYDSSGIVKNTTGGIVGYVASQAYSLPTAGSSTLGGVKINGNNLSIDASGVLSATDTTYTSKPEASSGTAESLCTTGEKYIWNHKLSDNPTFSAASSRTNIASGESVSTLFGKIMKWFTDLADLAFIAKDGVSSTKYLQGDGTWQTFPTIPTVNNGELSISVNGTPTTFTANQSGNSSVSITTDEWTATSTVTSSNTVTFSGLDDTLAYDLYCQDKLIGISSIVKTGSGSNVSIQYTVTGAQTGDVCKLRIVK